MSYRHSSYRKMCRAISKANTATAVGERPDLTRTEMNRVLHWSNQPSLPKPAGWGKPKRGEVPLWARGDATASQRTLMSRAG
ncbi:hypothetical protein AB0E62_00210 [Streptomyces sp. NPDC038707]|uniref:hypothetical protein n=1 Tax=Streptomyces sp. NPDC038707 TaxID=3154329 RepID=UPI0033D4E672